MRTKTYKFREPLSRRSLLTALSAGSLALATASEAEEMPLPGWMTVPGDGDDPYGLPAKTQAEAQRRLSPDSPGFEVWRSPLESLRGTITPNGLHFAVHHNGIPDIDPSTHRLLIHGLVQRPLSFDLEALMRYPLISRQTFIECAGNSGVNAASPFARDLKLGDISGEISASEWTGIPLRFLFAEAGLREGASWVVAEGADAGNHRRSLPLNKLMADGILALYQNGERLRPSQGYPMRIVIPGWEGNTQVKWLHRLEVCDQPAWTKDESGLYTDVLADGRIRAMSLTMEVKSTIVSPSGQQTIAHGPRQIDGIAWSGRGRITAVDLSADGGQTWAPARLHGPVQPVAFTRFSLPWSWEGEPALLMSRATDETGAVQPTRAEWRSRFASHTFNHYNAIQVWAVSSSGYVENVYA